MELSLSLSFSLSSINDITTVMGFKIYTRFCFFFILQLRRQYLDDKNWILRNMKRKRNRFKIIQSHLSHSLVEEKMKEEKAQCAHIQRKKRMSERNSREREKTSLFRSLIEVTEERNVDSRKMNKMKNKNLWKWKRKFNVRFGSSSNNNNNILSDLICFFFSSLYSGVMHNTRRKREREKSSKLSLQYF
jgi:hypothetical protein